MTQRRPVNAQYPTAAARLDWGNPILDGLGYAFFAPAGEDLVNAVGWQTLSSTWTASGLTIASGDGINTVNVANDPTAASTIYGSSEWSMLAVATPTTMQTRAALWEGPVDISGVCMGYSDSSTCFVYLDDGGAGTFVDQSAAGYFAVNTRGHFGVTFDGARSSQCEFWKDGVFWSSGNSSGTTTMATVFDSHNIVIGGSNNAGDIQKWQGEIELVFLWGRCLGSAEIQAITLNPWQLFQRPKLTLVPAASVASGTVLTRRNDVMGGGMSGLTGGMKN